MKDQRQVRVPVYLSRRVVRDRAGARVQFSQRRLVRQGPDDRILAIIAAPAGSRVRRREDQHGHDHLVVPRGQSIWARLFGPRVSIPAKYVISDARSGSYGLDLLEFRPPAESNGPPANDTALLATHQIVSLFPEPMLDSQGQPTGTRLDRGSARFRYALRLAWARLLFRL